MTTTIQIKAVGSSIYSEVAKKDFLGALEDCDAVNDIIGINGTSYTLSSVILCDCDSTPTVGTTTTSTVADVYTADGTPDPVVLATGLRVALNVNVTNTGASTVDFDGTGVKDIELDGAALTGEELQAGQRYPLVYNGTSFQLATNTSTTTSKFTIKGNLDCSANPNYPAAEVGDAYRVTVAGKIGGGAGRNVQVGDMIVCWATTDGGTQGADGVNWTIEQDELDAATLSDVVTATSTAKYITPATASAAIQYGYNPYFTCSSGAADDYEADSEVTLKVLKVGERYRFLCDFNNTGGAATLKLGSTQAYPLLRNASDPTAATVKNGSAYIVVFTGSAFEIETTLVVNSITGDNTLETSDKYQSITAAQTAAAGGSKIVIEVGGYSDTSLGKDGVTYDFQKGARLLSAGNCFADAGNPISFAVTGKGYFSSSSSVFYLTGASTVTCDCFYAIGTGAGSRTIWLFGSANLVMNCETDISLTGLESTVRVDGANAVLAITCDRMIGYGGVVGTTNTSTSAKVVIRAREFRYEATGAGYVGFGVARGSVELYGKIYIVGNGLYALPAIYHSNVGSLKIYGEIISTSTDGLLACTAAGTIDFFGDITANGKIDVTLATVNFRGKVINNYATKEAIHHISGKTIIHSLVKNLDNSATGHGIQSDAAGLILKQGASIYCTGAADSVYAAAARNIKTYPGAVANTALNVNITEQVGTIVVSANVDAE